MKSGDKDKLNECLDILDQTDLGLSLVWLWTWSTVKGFLEDGEWDQLVSEDEAWELLCKAVESGHGFSLEYGAEQHHEDVMEWMLDEGLIKSFDEEEEDEDE
jgi:hypothetical protein